jgi:hypothetical protein
MVMLEKGVEEVQVRRRLLLLCCGGLVGRGIIVETAAQIVLIVEILLSD